MEENLTLILKNSENLTATIAKQQQQQQMVVKYLVGIIREKTLTSKEDEGSVSREKKNENILDELSDELKLHPKSDDEKLTDRSKFKKVEILVFNGTNPDSWLFQADRFFKIHSLPD